MSRKGSAPIKKGEGIPANQYAETQLNMSMRKLLSDSIGNDHVFMKDEDRVEMNMYDTSSFRLLIDEDTLYLEFQLSDEYFQEISDNYPLLNGNSITYRMNLTDLIVPDFNVSHEEVEGVLHDFSNFLEEYNHAEILDRNRFTGLDSPTSKFTAIEYIASLLPNVSSEEDAAVREKLEQNKEIYLNLLHPVEYKLSDDDTYKPLKVFGDPPIVGDADPFAICISQNDTLALLEQHTPAEVGVMFKADRLDLAKSLEPIRIAERNKLRAMLAQAVQPGASSIEHSADAYVHEIHAITPRLANLEDYCRSFFNADTAGFATPLEFQALATVIDELLQNPRIRSLSSTSLDSKKASSQELKTDLVNCFASFIQHGPETNNPGTASDLNDTIVWYWQNQKIITNSEKEHIDFLFKRGDYADLEGERPVDSIFIKVHKDWPMEYDHGDGWAAVIDAQIESWENKFALKHNLDSDSLTRLKADIERREDSAIPERPGHARLFSQDNYSQLLQNFQAHVNLYTNHILGNRTFTRYNEYKREQSAQLNTNLSRE